MKEVQLFINNQEVEFSQAPDILFTFQTDELTNPTIVKNSYSKTITIDGTPQNNAIFGGLWDVQRKQDLVTFNPSKKAPFVIYHNGTIYQSGYCKLLNIDLADNHITYNISLFGGLGDFFYSLMYSTSDDVGESEKRKLSDLYFGTNATATTSADEFDFQINKGTVQEAWSQLTASTTGSMWNTINFAPCYNGLPDGFDADKVLINTNGNATIARNYTSGGTTYSTYENFVLGELNTEYTEWQMRDLRSYLQRPVIRVKDIIGAIANPDNNGGYEVDLDEDFFNSGNPYYWKSWMTLPMLSSLDYDNTKEAPNGRASLGAAVVGTGDTNYKFTTNQYINISGMPEDAKSYNLSVDVDLQAILNSNDVSNIVTAATDTELATVNITAYDSTGVNYPSAIEVQLVAYDQNGRVCGGSDNIHITNIYQHRGQGGGGSGRGGRRPVVSNDVIPSMSDLNFTPVYSGANSTQLLSYFDHIGTGKTNWQLHSGLSLTIKNVKKGWDVRLVITKVNNSPSAATKDVSKYLYQPYYYNGSLRHRKTSLYHFNVVLNAAQVTFNTNEAIRSGSRFKKAQLLNTDYTPADWLLSYAKQFGLYFSKDVNENKIYIRTRKSFYKADEVKDLDLLIDHNKQKTINPILFNAKWYNWQLEPEEGYFSKSYKDTYGLNYGVQKVNTGYNFDGNDNNLLKDNIFKTAIECTERSDMFSYISGDTTEKPWEYQGFKYNLYSTTNFEDSYEMTYSATTRLNKLKSFSNLKYYDLFSKVQLHGDDNNPSDGSKILLFFDTFVPCKSKATGDDVNYWLTDDNNAMAILNEDTPCWLYTVQNTADAVKLSAIPHFGRYLINDAESVITSSWDFGEPKQLYIPEVSTSDKSTIYNQYWKRYISDLYDIDTKQMTCYVNFKGVPTEEWLRYFYWFDNSIWRINKIIDHNVTSNDSTKVEFIKVQDITDYTEADYEPIAEISIAFSGGSTETTVPNSGGTVRVYVTMSEQTINWFVNDGVLDYASPTRGLGSGYFDLTIPANTGDEQIVYWIACEDDYDTWSNSITITQGSSVFSGKFEEPWMDRNIYSTGETASLLIKSTFPWNISANTNYVTFSSTSGIGNPTVGETINVTWPATNRLVYRTTQFTITDTQGNIVNLEKRQEGIVSKDLLYVFSGGTKSLEYTSGKTAIAPDWITVTDNGDGTYAVTASENPTENQRTATLAFQGDDAVPLYYVEVVQEAGSGGTTGNFDITPKVWSYSENGGSQALTITNPSGKTWEFHNVPNWINTTMSGTGQGNINAIAASSTTVHERESVIILYNKTDDDTIALYCNQLGLPRIATALTLSNLSWVVDIPSSGGVATSANCSYTVTAFFDDGTNEDVTTLASISGSLVVASSMTESRHSAGTLTLTATYGGQSDSGIVDVYQSAHIPEITGISFTSLTWVHDVPASGGTANKNNCSYVVYEVYDNGSQIDVTSSATITGSLHVNPSELVARHSAGTLTLIAYYSGYTDSESVIAYQAAANAYINLTPQQITFGIDGGIAEISVESNVDWDVNVSGNTPTPPTPTGETEYLTFTVVSGGNITWERATSATSKTIQYKLNDGAWTNITSSTGTSAPKITVSVGDVVKFKGSNNQYADSSGTTYNNFGGTAYYDVSGNILSMIYGSDFENYNSLPTGYNFTFAYLFYKANCLNTEGLVLPSGLTEYCFSNMFIRSKITTAPSILPATTLVNRCYQYMFSNCSGLTTAPALQATALSEYCYSYMFENCVSLTTAPELPAPTLEYRCYQNMFKNCSSLNYIKCLATDISASYALSNWVSGVSANGTFVKDANMSGWGSGTSGIPSGWTITDN